MLANQPVGMDNERKMAPNKFNNFSDEIIYNNINRDNPLFFQDKNGISKYEETIQNYRNNLSKKLKLLKKVVPPSDSISLKNVNLSNNINERKKDFINILLPIITNQNQKIIVLRQRLIDSKNYLNKYSTLSQTDLIFIDDLADRYSVAKKNKHKIDIINDLQIGRAHV